MPPPTLPTRRPWPQTLLLTALALLIAAATIMLACGPAAQPIPEEGGDLPAAESPATPTPAPTVCLQGEIDGEWFEHCITPMPPKTPKYPNLSGNLQDRVEEFEKAQDAASGGAAEDSAVGVEVFFSTPNTYAVALWLRSKGVLPVDLEKEMSTYFVEDVGYIGGAIPLSLLGELSRWKGVVEVREPYPRVTGAVSRDPTATPTVEPTETPVPNSTECVSIPPEYQATPELAEGQIRVDGIAYQCFVVTPTPTPKYPELGEYNWIAVAGEEAAAQRDASQAGGASGQSEVEIPAVRVRITFSDQASTDAAFAWLQSKGVPRSEEVNESWRGGIDDRVVAIYGRGWNNIHAIVPASLLRPLSQQGGFIGFDLPPQFPTED